ncbi:MAG: hypothetical protein ACP5P4_13265 [Steroidobacteraceae bacterium]
MEWIRGHGGASFVAWAENTWYGLHKPPVGGKPPKGAIAAVSSKRATTTTVAAGPPHLAPPQNLKPFVSPPLAGEGVWQPQGRLIDGMAGLYTTSIRPSSVYSSLVTGVAWMDPKLLSFTLFAGGQEPGRILQRLLERRKPLARGLRVEPGDAPHGRSLRNGTCARTSPT